MSLGSMASNCSGIGWSVMPNEDLSDKAREFRRIATRCDDLVVYRALLELAEACDALAEEEALEGSLGAGQPSRPL